MLKKSKIIAVLSVCLMVFAVVEPAFAAWSGNDHVKTTAGNIGKGIEAVETVVDLYDLYDRGQKLYDANDNDERMDIAIDTAGHYAKGAVKTAVKTAANTAIVSSATPTAVYIAGAAGMTAKTGTAIATLSGAAATNATLCAIGTPVVSTLGIAAAPAVVGGFIVAGGASAVCYGVSWLIDYFW